ncbi:MAG: hypothetical protein JWQ43_2914 [Glaciihabitans sp.]|nr:hypothetical protein [Glaciihabitans sp.]
MPDASPPRQGAPVWTDLLSSDPDVSVPFYCQLFGWTTQQLGTDLGNYVNFSRHNKRVAGLVPNTGAGVDAWMVYLFTADTNATATAVETAGGLITEQRRMGDHGTMSMIIDAAGATVGSWQPAGHSGYELAMESGTAVWHELHTSAFPTAVDFYTAAFGWQTEVLGDSDEFRMVTLGTNGDGGAGIVESSAFLRDNEVSRWMVYFGVADPDESAATIIELGGTVIDEVTDSPHGRLAHAEDPTGVPFTIIGVL